jgi:hypothetical protein
MNSLFQSGEFTVFGRTGNLLQAIESALATNPQNHSNRPTSCEISENSLVHSLFSGNAPTGAGSAARGRLISNFEVAVLD